MSSNAIIDPVVLLHAINFPDTIIHTYAYIILCKHAMYIVYVYT